MSDLDPSYVKVYKHLNHKTLCCQTTQSSLCATQLLACYKNRGHGKSLSAVDRNKNTSLRCRKIWEELCELHLVPNVMHIIQHTSKFHSLGRPNMLHYVCIPNLFVKKMLLRILAYKALLESLFSTCWKYRLRNGSAESNLIWVQASEETPSTPFSKPTIHE